MYSTKTTSEKASFLKISTEGGTINNVIAYSNLTFQLFDSLHQELKKWLDKDPTCRQKNLLIIKSGLLLHKNKAAEAIILTIFRQSFEAYKVLNKELFKVSNEDDDESEEEDFDCPSCNSEKENCQCHVILENLTKLNSIFSELYLIEHVSNPAIVTLIYEQLTGFLDKYCNGEYIEPWLQNVFTWMEKGLLSWLQFATSVFQTKEGDNSIVLGVEDWKNRLAYFVYKAFAEMRISEMFEIIVEYPDSLPAINDLKECLSKTETRGLLTESLRSSFEKRLLHPAVNTDDILTQYVSAIRSLRELDPSGIILENVCMPLREYLRGRDDTIKCIITCLTDQGSGPDLSEELLGADDDSKGSEIESDGEDWVPDPIDAAKTDQVSKSQRNADIINILVNIYGSQDMFVSQYRILLADRILNNYSYDVSNERRYIELLKRRFGENHMHYCDIMLKDIQDSHRINRHIKAEMDKNTEEMEKEKKEEEKTEIEFNSFILSSAFWPTLANDSVEPPADVERLMEKYCTHFKESKGMRTLEWLNNLGSVEVEVDLEGDDGGVRTFNVTPAQATLLIKFQEKGEWTLNELSTDLNITKSSLRYRIAFWIGQGVIIEKQTDCFVSAQTFQSSIHDGSIYESDDEIGATSAQNQKDEELQVYWSYVVGMLTNIGSLPLDRIHSMLKMFASHDSSAQCTVDEVKSFLQSKVTDGELIYVGGVYKLPKSS